MTAAAMPLRFREPRIGPEQSLIDWFLSEKRLVLRADHRIAVFREPAIESGAPDVVLVAWKPSIGLNWSSARTELTKSDLRLLHLLVQQGPQTTAALERLCRFPLATALTRLERAEVIRRRGRNWQARALRHIFAASQIIAIEAKMSNWRRGLEQAAINRWFASTSYLLMPRAPRNETFWSEATAAGVGVWTKDERFQQTATSGCLPCSYASWLFHEFAWRQSLV